MNRIKFQFLISFAHRYRSVRSPPPEVIVEEILAEQAEAMKTDLGVSGVKVKMGPELPDSVSRCPDLEEGKLVPVKEALENYVNSLFAFQVRK